MTKNIGLKSYVKKAQNLMKRTYIEKGYFSSGSICMNDIYENIHSDREKAEIITDLLLESGKVQIRRNCIGLAFELARDERAKLIKEHNLIEKWSEKCSINTLNSNNGEVYSVLKNRKQNNIKKSFFHITAC